MRGRGDWRGGAGGKLEGVGPDRGRAAEALDSLDALEGVGRRLLFILTSLAAWLPPGAPGPAIPVERGPEDGFFILTSIAVCYILGDGGGISHGYRTNGNAPTRSR